MQRSLSRMSVRRTGRQNRSRSHGAINRKRCLRVVVMGAAGVGKTCIINRFLYDEFPLVYVATVEENHRAEYEIAGTTVTLDILDTSGSFQFPAMRKLSISTGDAFVLVFSVDDEASFEEVKVLRQQILEEKGGDAAAAAIPIVVVGNKAEAASSKARQVRKEVTESTVSIEWGNGYVETSAVDATNIVDIFDRLLELAHVHSSMDSLSELLNRRKSCPYPDTHKKKLHKANRKHMCVIM